MSVGGLFGVTFPQDVTIESTLNNYSETKNTPEMEGKTYSIDAPLNCIVLLGEKWGLRISMLIFASEYRKRKDYQPAEFGNGEIISVGNGEDQTDARGFSHWCG